MHHPGIRPRRRKPAWLAACAFACLALPAGAQTPGAAYGGIRGVAQANGRAVPDAYITVHSVAGNFDRNVVSDADGAYTVSDLAAGAYAVSAERIGYDSPAPVTVTVAAADTSFDLHLKPKPLVRTFWDKLWRIKPHTAD